MKRSIKGIFISAIASALLLTGCSTGQSSTESKKEEKVSFENVPERFADGDGARIKVIRKIGGDDHTAQYLAGAKEEGEALRGFKWIRTQPMVIRLNSMMR